MSRGRSIFFIFQLCSFAIFLVCSSIRFAMDPSQTPFTFTRPITCLGFGIWDLGFVVVWSKLSWPLIMLNISFASSGVFVIGPMQSNVIAKSSSPYLETAPCVGFSPMTPQCDAGFRIEPPVSEPSVKSARLAAIAAAGPELEPPGISSGFVGFFVGPKAEVSPDAPHANSSMLRIPK